ncbi:hypothetical protein [Caulobacter segnis]
MMSEKFNYIAFGNHDLVKDDRGQVTMSRRRMLEYTPADIRTRLEALDARALAYLDKLPTFLCSEITRSARGAGMLVKYGRVATDRGDTSNAA